MGLAVVRDAKAFQLLGYVAPLRKLGKPSARPGECLNEPIGCLERIASCDLPVNVLNIALRIFSEKNAMMHSEV